MAAVARAVVEQEGGAELAVWRCCLRTCHTWDLEPPMAMLISEALTGYLYDGSRPQTQLATSLAKATAVLHHATGGVPDGGALACPASTGLTPSAIAALIEWCWPRGGHLRWARAQACGGHPGYDRLVMGKVQGTIRG